MKKKKGFRWRVYLRRLLKRMTQSDGRFWLMILACLFMVVFGVFIYIHKYAPTKESLTAAEYYATLTDDEAVVFLDGKKMEPDKNATFGNAICVDGHAYLELSFTKEYLDDGYVYDASAGVLRYTTDAETISVNREKTSYSSGRSDTDMGAIIVREEYDTAYLLLDFVEEFTDVSGVVIDETPGRICLEKAGYEKTTATVKKNTVMRQYGGPKSKIVSELQKKETVSVVGSAGKWVWVLSDQGILGCVKSSELKNKETVVVEPRLEEREYKHISLKEPVCAGWHEVTVKAENRNLEKRLSKTKKMNVTVPTWMALADNGGALSNLASMDYVTTCHNQNIQVWAEVSDSLNPDVSTTAVLNNVASRDNLVNNIVASAVAYDMDGVTVSFSKVSDESKDGWSQFVRELSLKCENNDLVLALNIGVDNESAQCYNYAVLNDYGDYVFASFSVETLSESADKEDFETNQKAIDAASESVEASRLVLGVPLYIRAYNEETEDYSGDIQTVEAETLAKYLQYMQDKKLAGAAFWRLGVESDGIWEVISLYIK